MDRKRRGLLAGIVMPSHDAVGRRFPLVVCAPLPTAALAGQPHAAPLVLHGFFNLAVVAGGRAARVRSQAEFCTQVASVAPPSFEGAPACLARYVSWARGKRAAEVWTSLFGEDAGRASSHALSTLVEATAAYRGQETPPLSLGVRVPLGGDSPKSAAMWLDSSSDTPPGGRRRSRACSSRWGATSRARSSSSAPRLR